MKREIKIFLRRNRIQLIIALLCVLLTIKQMEAPFIFKYNKMTSLLFEKIPQNSVWHEFIELINNLGFAYYSSLIFYFVVDYFPARRKEKAAFHLVKDHLSDLCRHLDCLFTDLLFFTGNGKTMEDLKGKSKLLFTFPTMKLTLEPVLCNKEIMDKATGRLWQGSHCEELNSFHEIQNQCRAIMAAIDTINNHMGANELEEEIVRQLSILAENRYIDNMCHLNEVYLKEGNNAIVCACQTSDFIELLRVYDSFSKLPIKQYFCVLEKATEEERQNILRDLEKLKKEHPESWEMYQALKIRARRLKKLSEEDNAESSAKGYRGGRSV